MDSARRRPLSRLATDRRLVIASLVLVVLLAWAYLVVLAGSMQQGEMAGMDAAMPMEGMAMTPAPWSATTLALQFAMWWVMMIGMMIPSSLPTILLYSRVQHHYGTGGVPRAYVASFVAGYLLVWGAFSAVAAVAQWALASVGALSPDDLAVGTTFAAVLLAVAGVYQLTPLKYACLRHCRSPAEFLTAHRRPGFGGALVMGAHHGTYCVGCCWLLMTLLFVGGVMNLLWVAALAVLVLLEKAAPLGHWLARASGIAMLAAAALLSWLALT